MKFLYCGGADAVFLFHSAWVFVGLFGWAIPTLWYPYLVVVVSTLFSYIVIRKCIFTRWEFYLRRKANPYHAMRPDDWMPYYLRAITRQSLRRVFLWRAGIFFLLSSLALNLYFHYLYQS